MARVGLVTICYNEGRFILPFLHHIPDWVEEKLVLITSKPWFGEPEEDDGTEILATKAGATVIVHDWANEEEQRNAGQDYFNDYDWIIILDPDEFLDNDNWARLKELIDANPPQPAFVVDHQLTYWKNGYVADPPRDYQQLILARPSTRFIDKRVVNTGFGVAPVFLHHFSWRRTDEEVWSKISHYAHAEDFDIKSWYKNVWLKWQPGDEDVHPTSPDTLHKMIPDVNIMPPEIRKLGL